MPPAKPNKGFCAQRFFYTLIRLRTNNPLNYMQLEIKYKIVDMSSILYIGMPTLRPHIEKSGKKP